jgi:hypothetical protein
VVPFDETVEEDEEEDEEDDTFAGIGFAAGSVVVEAILYQ